MKEQFRKQTEQLLEMKEQLREQNRDDFIMHGTPEIHWDLEDPFVLNETENDNRAFSNQNVKQTMKITKSFPPFSGKKERI